MELLLRLKKFPLNLAIIIISTLVLNGCAGNVNIAEPITAKTQLTAKQGVVVLRVINTSTYPLPFNFVTIAPKNLNESKEVKFERLQALKTHVSDNNIFASAVSSGSYSLADIYSHHVNGDFMYSRGAAADAKFGTFNVEAGKVTDLGTIIYYPKPQGDQYLNTLTRLPSENHGELLANFFPFYNFDREQGLTWNEDELEEDRRSLYVSIAQNPITFKEKLLTDDGSIYFIGKLGVIIKRLGNDEWDIEAVDTNVDLSVIEQDRAGNIIIAGNEGKVFIKRIGADWQDISINNFNNIKQVIFRENNEVDLLSFSQNSMQVFRGNIAEMQPNWQLMASYSSYHGWKDGDGNVQAISALPKDKRQPRKKQKVRAIFNVKAASEANQHVVTITYGNEHQLAAFGHGVKKEFSYQPTNWQVTELESSLDIKKTIQAGAVKIAIEEAGFWSMTGRPTFYRVDPENQNLVVIASSIKSCKEGYTQKGKLCIKGEARKNISSKAFSFVSLPWFKNQNEALSIVSFRSYNFWTSRSKTDYKIVKSNDSGISWQETELELPNEYCMNIITEVKERILLSCAGVSSDFYESLDFGETWQHVREHENF